MSEKQTGWSALRCRKCNCAITIKEHSDGGGRCYLCASEPKPRATWDENRLGERGYERKETL